MSSYDNPSELRVGMDGTLSGIHFRVIGRVDLSTEEDGETYTWQEFNLAEDGGRTATLVLEEGENGPEWKLFMDFVPTRPLTAAEADGKQVGDTVTLEDRPVEITFVGRSRVDHIEGQAPEGVEIGDVARFFNADEGERMLVVSWTGDEVEYYRGIDVPTQEVRTSFGLSSFTPEDGSGAAFLSSATGASSSSRVVGVVVAAIIVAVIGIAMFSWWNRARTHSGPRTTALRAEQLAVGKKGTLQGRSYTVAGNTKAEILRTGSRYDWQEYKLHDEAGNAALLVGGLNPGANQWILFVPVTGENLLSPFQAAALRGGDLVNLAGRQMRVSDLFQCYLVSRDGQTLAVGKFGFLARSAEEHGLVRWSENEIEFFHGRQVPTKEVEAAFKSGSP